MSSQKPSSHPKLIIDTDPGVDDILAIIFALGSPEVDLAALTLVFGNTTLDYARSNILRLGRVLRQHLKEHQPGTERALPSEVAKALTHALSQERAAIPVYLGAEEPLEGQRFTASYFHGRDGLSGVSQLEGDPFPENPASGPEAWPFVAAQDKSSSDAILDILRTEPPGTVRIAAVGPLTNLALAWRKDPQTFSRVGHISVMGGAVDHPGNTTAVSEFNFFADPSAAATLLEIPRNHPALAGTPLPLHILPLDITEKHVVPYTQLIKDDPEKRTKSGSLAHFVSAFLQGPRTFNNGLVPPGVAFDPEKHDQFQAHDPLAIAHAIFAPAGGWVSTPRAFLVETEGKRVRGMCVVDRRGNASNDGDGGVRAEENADHEKRPYPVQVVTASPRIDWFANIFTVRLGI